MTENDAYREGYDAFWHRVPLADNRMSLRPKNTSLGIEAGYRASWKLATSNFRERIDEGLGSITLCPNGSAHFHAASKFVLTWLMLLGRLEVFTILVLFVPQFWRAQ